MQADVESQPHWSGLVQLIEGDEVALRRDHVMTSTYLGTYRQRKAEFITYPIVLVQFYHLYSYCSIVS